MVDVATRCVLLLLRLKNVERIDVALPVLVMGDLSMTMMGATGMTSDVIVEVCTGRERERRRGSLWGWSAVEMEVEVEVELEMGARG